MLTSDAIAKNFQVTVVTELLFQLHQWASGRDNASDAIDKLVGLYQTISPADDTYLIDLLREAVVAKRIKTDGSFQEGKFFDHLINAIGDTHILSPHSTADKFRTDLIAFNHKRPTEPEGDVLEQDLLKKIVEKYYGKEEAFDRDDEREQAARHTIPFIKGFERNRDCLAIVLQKYTSKLLPSVPTTQTLRAIELLATAYTLQGEEETDRPVFLSWLRNEHFIDIHDPLEPPSRKPPRAKDQLDILHLDATKFNVDYALDHLDEMLREQGVTDTVRGQAIRDLRRQCQFPYIS